ncbi:MAG: thioredoxin-dependent peroxiredoxin [Patescibacteria group bacterium]|jgi:peroxiredoxin Q/BCP|nr:thioredoxin-dependent peroxiredoxin [Patescibacteria group bacterium]
MSLNVGDNAPQFNLLDQSEKEHSLDELKGKTTLIYFYPKDETPGCTAQACSLRDNIHDLKNNGIDVIGVSKDDVGSHSKFATKYQLPFTILSDPSTKMIDAYGAWGERNMYGRKFMGTIRSGVLVGPDLRILAVWPKLQPLKTVSEVEKFINS